MVGIAISLGLANGLYIVALMAGIVSALLLANDVRVFSERDFQSPLTERAAPTPVLPIPTPLDPPDECRWTNGEKDSLGCPITKKPAQISILKQFLDVVSRMIIIRH